MHLTCTLALYARACARHAQISCGNKGCTRTFGFMLYNVSEARMKELRDELKSAQVFRPPLPFPPRIPLPLPPPLALRFLVSPPLLLTCFCVEARHGSGQAPRGSGNVLTTQGSGNLFTFQPRMRLGVRGHCWHAWAGVCACDGGREDRRSGSRRWRGWLAAMHGPRIKVPPLGEASRRTASSRKRSRRSRPACWMHVRAAAFGPSPSLSVPCRQQLRVRHSDPHAHAPALGARA